MAHPFIFEAKGLTFCIEGRKLFLDGQEVSFRDFILFLRGKIDLTPPEPEPLPSIVDIVIDASGAEGLDNDGGDFDILREALVATNLVGVLADREADFTVLAPTDAAFIRLAQDLGADVTDGDEAGALTAILAALESLAGSSEGGLDLLKQVLLYHVAPDGRTLAELQADGTITTAQGGEITLDGTTLVDGEPDIANPSIVAQDIAAANGTIQVLDRVLLPIDIPGNDLPNIVDIAASSDDFNILVKALAAAGLLETVQGLTDVTVFAPTDAAFTQLAVDLGFGGDQTDEDAVFGFIAGALAGLAEDGDPIPLLTNILLYHVSAGAKSANQIDEADQIDTLLTGATFGTEGTELIDNEPDIDNPNIVIPDIAADNGTIQAIDRVLIPLDIPGNTQGEVINGTFRGDKLVGTAGDDEINGFFGRDHLDGGAGNDMLNGGAGRDVLVGGEGNDHLKGGWGRDTFDFRELSGDDVVKDLSRWDKVVFSQDDFGGFHDLRAATTFEDGEALITTEDGTVTLEHVNEHRFDGHQFFFA
ncbi:MAG: fasciclin domain-containing protein [Paracoccaceae bacterium]